MNKVREMRNQWIQCFRFGKKNLG